jgi:ribosomal protein S8E
MLLALTIVNIYRYPFGMVADASQLSNRRAAAVTERPLTGADFV